MDFIYDFLKDVLRVSISLFIVVDSVGNIPIFISLTEDLKKRRRFIFRQSIFISFILLMFFSILGEGILRFFNIKIYSFAIAGGVLLLFISMKMLAGRDEYGKERREFLGAVPLAFPLLVGPGAITTAMLSIQNYGIIQTVVSVIIVSAINWLILMNAERINSFFGKTGSIVVSKLMAIFISAISVEYITFGISGFIDKLKNC